MTAEITRHKVFALKVGGGNPRAAEAYAETIGGESKLISNPLVIAASRFHRHMTQDSGSAERYTAGKDGALRAGILGQALGFVAAIQLKAAGIKSGDYIVHEMPQRYLQPQTFGIIVPDALPKNTAMDIFIDHPPKEILVWNRTALELLQNTFSARGRAGIEVRMVPVPYQRNHENIRQEYGRVFIQASGSGMPVDYAVRIAKQFADKDCPVDIHNYSLTGLTIKIVKRLRREKPMMVDGVTKYSRRRIAIHNYGDLPTSTKESIAMIKKSSRVVCYPSEMTGIMADLVAHGWQGRIYALMPRGSHEVANLAWAVRFGLIEDVIVDSEETAVQLRGHLSKTYFDIDWNKINFSVPESIDVNKADKVFDRARLAGELGIV